MAPDGGPIWSQSGSANQIKAFLMVTIDHRMSLAYLVRHERQTHHNAAG
jgi:hypothetical protein